MATGGKHIIDIDSAKEVKQLIEINDDIEIAPELEKQVNAFDDDDLLKVTKTIGSFTKILAVELVTEELLQKDL